jgi:DNA-binding transcriptional regulator YbjK
MTQDSSKSKAVRSRGEKTRLQIIEAALQIIAREGVRAITHRVVAREAGVSLGSTTYYFKDIDDLISSSFEQWREQAASLVDPQAQKVKASVEKMSAAGKVSADELAAHLTKSMQRYLRLQLADRQNRLIEIAFYQEAVYNPRVNKLVHANRERELKVLRSLFEVLGSSDAAADAELLTTLMHELERLALMDEKPARTNKRHRLVLKRFFEMYVKTGL